MRADAQKNYDRLLAVARDVVIKQGAGASLRDIARRAGVGLGTLYRHFPNREALLEAILHSSFEALTKRADELQTSSNSAEALVLWLQEIIAVAHEYRGALASMVSAMEDPNSALHASCAALHEAGTALLIRAQADGSARADLDGSELFDLIAALAWLREQPAHASRADHIFSVIAGAILTIPKDSTVRGHSGRRAKKRS